MNISELVKEGHSIIETGNEEKFKVWQRNIRAFKVINRQIDVKEKNFIDAAMECSLDMSSDEEKQAKIIATATETIRVLEIIEKKLGNPSLDLLEMPTASALVVIDRILKNFYVHIDEMYHADTYKEAGISKSLLEPVKIKNEYDVQRMLYSVIKVIFPRARIENSISRYSFPNRYKILVDEYDVQIEIKCIQSTTEEQAFINEIELDILKGHLKQHHFFLVYDQDKLIQNKESFESACTKKASNKNIRTFLIQPID